MDTLTLADLDIVRTWHLPVRAASAAADQPEDDPAETALATMEVRFSIFNTWYEIDSWHEGQFLERTVKGAFAKTISESGSRVKVLFNHGMDFMIGDKLLGEIESLTEETDSPLGVVDLFDTLYNRELLPGLRAGVYGSSFMFRVIQDEWNQEPGTSDYNPAGIPERTIKEVRLFEFGPVTWPANPDATAGLRCTSGTDSYYELLRRRDPHRVDGLRSRITAHRTSRTTSAAAALTDPVEAAPAPTTEPVQRHSGGLSHADRRAALYSYLRRTPDESGAAPAPARGDRD
jgi:HK97 family phage prohead protease